VISRRISTPRRLLAVLYSRSTREANELGQRFVCLAGPARSPAAKLSASPGLENRRDPCRSPWPPTTAYRHPWRSAIQQPPAGPGRHAASRPTANSAARNAPKYDGSMPCSCGTGTALSGLLRSVRRSPCPTRTPTAARSPFSIAPHTLHFSWRGVTGIPAPRFPGGSAGPFGRLPWKSIAKNLE